MTTQIGTVEAFRDDDAEKNRLCPPLTFTGNISDVLNLAYIGMTGLLARSAEPDLATWTEDCRLNPARGAMERMGEAQVAAALALLGSNIEPALRNLADRAGVGYAHGTRLLPYAARTAHRRAGSAGRRREARGPARLQQAARLSRALAALSFSTR